MMTKTLITLLSVLALNTAMAQHEALYEKKEFISGNDTLRYRMLLPVDYKPSKKYPLILVLHGSGERGSDNEAQLKHGGKLFTDSTLRAKYPAIVIFPQCPRNDGWPRISRDTSRKDSLKGMVFNADAPIGKTLGLVSQLLDQLVADKKVNSKRIYVGGLSLGGMGTFELCWRKPGFFAAAFPICGAGDPSKVSLYGRKFPIWVFHGDADNAVPVAGSRLMVNALKASGAKVKYNEYPGVGHNSWDNAFAEPDLIPWLMKQNK